DGVYLLDREMDADHNRCVITLVGEREPIQEAAIRGVGKAAELIDLNVHQGAHPRMGAADVVPFIPIEGVTIEDCVAMARHVGEQIWQRHQIPVYLYEAAATIPERQNLESIRRGQFEGIRAEIATIPARKPDFGDLRVHPTAGATVVGARKFLIAYNIFLNTPDVEIAKKVAKAVRFSSGGMRFVRGAGILESVVAAGMGGKLAVGGLPAGVAPFVEQLAAPTATPGGGSAAATSGAMAAGLATMVASMSRGKKAYVQYEPELSDAIARLSQLREELKTAIDADANSYNAVMNAYKAAKSSAEGDGLIDAALKQATSVPLSVAERAKEVAEIADKLKPITNPNMKSDLTTASALARAAIEGALANVDINLESLKDQGFVSEMRRKAGALKA